MYVAKKDLRIGYKGRSYQLKKGDAMPAGLNSLSESQRAIYFEQAKEKKAKKEADKPEAQKYEVESETHDKKDE